MTSKDNFREMLNRITSGILRPGIILGIMEIPVLVFYFSGTNPFGPLPGIYGNAPDVQGQLLLLLFVSLAFIIGILAKDPRRAILIFILSQMMAFSLSCFPLFVYPNTTQGTFDLVPCCFYPGQHERMVSRFAFFIAGWAILVTLVGLAIAGVAFILGERLGERRLKVRVTNDPKKNKRGTVQEVKAR